MRTRSEDQTDNLRGAQRSSVLTALRWLLLATLATVALFGIGLLVFVSQIEKSPPNSNIQADAIVVLTGGDSRVTEAVRLLAAGRGRRLLISGVHPKTTTAMLRRINPEAERLFDCCIDLDRNARDTIENADETRRWAAERGFRSVIVVTSSYHMPRGLVELRRALPSLELIPYPVVPARLRLDAWWAHPGTFRLLASEYAKYVASVARCAGVRLMGGGRGIHGCFDPLSV
ncbi:uncharacterized SAM-binding protein YcdF (DUF218 family) [Dichotomicrobium thermohalophilum]|uniref:Uncharacterized SAM-binding protein YcdF (DUF218 family) n=2 Tax=Dichotomicrobium thermohalophilum TaxID=933063 RepID=A0A397PES6_9HYPH|nr:uncharacterized SAM-binding protein YcdF (DUF218 family) [Dichotomicrobium thermohalophilum]